MSDPRHLPPRRWLRETAALLAAALLPPPRRLEALFDRIERLP